MSFFDWLFGDDDPEPVTYNSTTSTSIPPYIEEPSRRMIAEAERLAGIPYTAYNQQRIAEFNPDQMAAFQRSRDTMGIGGLTNVAAAGGAAGAARDLNPADLARYTNPYLAQVGQAAEAELVRQNETAKIGDAYAASKAGAFGGSRHAIVESERDRNLQRTTADMYTGIFAGGFDKALNQFNQQRQQEVQAALATGSLGGAAQNYFTQDVNMGLGIGGLQQDQSQKNFDLAYNDFLRQQQYPYEQLTYLNSIIRGTPMAQSSTTSQQVPGTPTQGFFQQAAGLGIAGLGAAGNLGWRPFSG